MGKPRFESQTLWLKKNKWAEEVQKLGYNFLFFLISFSNKMLASNIRNHSVQSSDLEGMNSLQEKIGV